MSVIEDTEDHIVAIDGQKLSLSDLQKSPDCVTLLNENGRISFVNETEHSALDIQDLEEVVGLIWWQLWPTEHQSPLKAAFERALSGQIATYWGRAADGDGTQRDWDVRMTPIPNPDATVSSVLVISREVTQVLA